MTLNAPVAAFSSQDALVAVMVGVSASDANPTARELMSIQRMIDTLPVFVGYDRDRLQVVGRTVFDLFTEEDGLDALFGLVRDALPPSLRETAYALACDVAAVDGEATQEELRVLELMRHRLNIDRLIAAGIERGARARFQTL
jgi:tellurite resistance protein